MTLQVKLGKVSEYRGHLFAPDLVHPRTTLPVFAHFDLPP